ncbi:hypothetical protein DL96DRAFT_1686030 [Flagelloscypha sp. PMI_526]|nr:hypothetical protein DL96DRAFT_1686030 [Flagelloscypha sp. PMI_526]
MPASFRERVDTASAIRGILDSYPFGNGLLREILQNSDDAGATQQTFVLDCRSHPSSSLVDPVLRTSQGPSLLCLNDSLFRETDWTALQTINGSNKRAEDQKTGKYGLGFRSCYHITDNPHILSANSLVIFDPYNQFESPHDGGARIDLSVEGGHYHDQLQAFSPFFDPQSTYHDGTVVRLPLRTPQQLKHGGIRDESFSPESIRTLFDRFIQDELTIALLFLKNVHSIVLLEIDSNGLQKHCASASISNVDDIRHLRAFFRGDEDRYLSFSCNVQFRRSDEEGITESWLVSHAITNACDTASAVSGRTGFEVSERLKDDKLYSHVAMAFPLGHTLSNAGRLFVLLPLPIYTGFPVHLHGVVALMPDRQNMKNPNECGHTKESRENLRVQWNHTVFQDFVPRLWNQVLMALARIPFDNIWDAFPSPTEDVYFAPLITALFSLVIGSQSAVFPVWGSQGKFSAASAALFVLESKEDRLLQAISDLNISLIHPPQRLLSILANDHRLVSLTPRTLSPVLLSRLQAQPTLFDELNFESKMAILEFLVAEPGGNFDFIRGLPLLPTVSDTFVSLQASFPLILAGQTESELFSRVAPNMIAKWHLPPLVKTSVEGRLPPGIAKITARDLTGFLSTLLTNTSEIEVLESNLSVPLTWFPVFWEWACTMKILAHSEVLSLPMLPVSGKKVRRLGAGVLSRRALAFDMVVGLENVGVPFISASSNVKEDWLSTLPTSIFKASSDLGFVLDNLKPLPLPENGLAILRGYICSHAARRGALPNRELQILRNLPIFPSFAPGSGNACFTSIQGTAVFLNHVPLALPEVKNITFVDVSANQPFRDLALHMDVAAFHRAKSEIQLLEWSVPYLDSQSESTIDRLLRRIITRSLDLSPTILQQLRQLSVFPTRGQLRQPSNRLIDPFSPIAPLFKGENERILSSNFDGLIGPMRSSSLIQSSLTTIILTERITTFSTTTEPSLVSKKSLDLLRLLDASWDERFRPFLGTNTTWISAGGGLYPSSQCRPILEDDLLYDLTLPRVPLRIESQSLRDAMGWNLPPTSMVILEQFRRTIGQLSLRDPKNGHRVKGILTELSERHSLSQEHILEMKSLVADIPWIPLDVDSCRYVSNRNAILTPDHPLNLVGSFRVLPEFFTSQPRIRELLVSLGCSDCPTSETLLTELEKFSNVRTPSMTQVAILLEELAARDLEEEERALIRVPDISRTFRPSTSLVYNDTHSHVVPTGYFMCHSKISRDLASSLSITYASTIAFGDDDDDLDDIEMGEDFCQRINGLLRDYNISYAANEFIANAIDAGAGTFDFALDLRSSYNLSSSLPSAMHEILSEPSLLLYNEEKFTDADFRGLRAVGKGGKADREDTIGRYGLGAITMFHFTDLPMIISGDCVLILDPSKSFLPPKDTRQRTFLYRKLSSVRALGLLDLVDGLWGCKSSSDFFPGIRSSKAAQTIFRLPLRKHESGLGQAITNKTVLDLLTTNYATLARSSLFFSSLQSISAYSISLYGRQTTLWAFNAERSPLPQFQPSCSSERLVIIDTMRQIPLTECVVTRLRIPTDEVPAQHHPLMARYKLLRGGLQVAIALWPSSNMLGETGKFFSRLMLPVDHSLPCFIDGPFALPSDRRNLRSDPIIDDGVQDLESLYNLWLLSSPISTVYLHALTVLCTYACKDSALRKLYYKAWPLHSETQSPLAGYIRTAFKSKLPTYSGDAVISDSEPRAVTKILQLLHVPTFVPLHKNLKQLCDDSSLHVVDGSFLTESLLPRVSNFIPLSLPRNGVSLLPRVTTFEVDTALQYILSAEAEDPGLPLLFLQGNLAPITFSSARQTIYYAQNDIRSFIPLQPLLNHDFYTSSTVQALLDSPRLDVSVLSAASVVEFMRQWIPEAERLTLDADQQQRLDIFWRLRSDGSIPDPAHLASFRRLPVFPTLVGTNYVALSLVQQQGLLADVDTIGIADLAEVVDLLGFILIPLSPAFSDIIKTQRLSLETLSEKVTAQAVRRLPIEHQRRLAGWMTSRISSFTSEDVRTRLRDLPLWECLPGGPLTSTTSSSFIAAHALVVIPSPLSLETLQPYLPNTSWYLNEADAPTLKHLRIYKPARYRKKRCIQPEITLGVTQLEPTTICSVLRFPLNIEPGEAGQFRSMIQSIISFAGRNISQIKVPRENLSLAFPRELYSFSIDLFNKCFSGPQFPVRPFLHSMFHDFEHRLATHAQLRNTLNADTFYDCVKAIHDTLELLPPNALEDEYLERAEAAFAYYNNTLPSQIMATSDDWQRFYNLRFIPRCVERRRSGLDSTLPIDFRPLPQIVAPCDVVRPDAQLEAVCWSQRARLEVNTVIQTMLLLNGNFGRPEGHDMVQHLRYLASHASQNYAGTTWLLRDLKETYTALQDHTESALLATYNQEKLFLNVNDPEKDTWIWMSASSLVLDLACDQPSRDQFTVLDFLDSSYRALLVDAGARTIRNPTIVLPDVQGSAMNEGVRVVCNEMREAGELLDIEFVPEFDDGKEFKAGNPQALKGHKLFLAASLPHLREAFKSGMQETSTSVFSFAGSVFAAASIIEFLYTNKIELPVLSSLDPESVGDLVENVLGILPIADRWSMESLKDYMAKLIFEAGLVLPETCHQILADAEEYNASSLQRYCHQYIQDNYDSVEIFSL